MKFFTAAVGVSLMLPCAAADLAGGATGSIAIDRAAASGNAEAQRRLAFRYYHGEGVAQNNAKAVAWFEKAAATGDTESTSNLAKMYEYGMGVAQDDKRAAEWYRRAAELGEASSQFSLSVMYYQGQGLSQDRVEAAKWWNIAIGHGGAWAEKIRATVESAEARLTPAESAEGKRRATEWLKERPAGK